jgi:protein-disulfide isomerase
MLTDRNFPRACRPALQLAALTLVAATLSHGIASAATTAAADDLAAAPQNRVLATVGKERITEAAVIGQDREAFDNLNEDNAIRLHQLQAKQAEARYTLLKRDLDKLLDKRALEMEAKARNTTGEVVLADIKVSVVTEEEERAYFEANKFRAGNRTFEQLQSEITQFLANQHTQATRSFFDELRAKHGISSTLEPFRVAVAADGPARGNEHAPVTIVEFGDFQCPFCRQEETVLNTVLGRHPDDVRLVFRELPLTGIHPNALGAAQAAVCADRQGKFWAMHNAMYGDQNALSQSALVDTARRIGLDPERFSACLADSETAKAVERDAKAADELNIDETPYFIINGRPLHGSVPVDQLEAVVSDELHRVASKRS